MLFDLKKVAQNREGSTLPLSPHQQKIFQTLKNKYGPIIKSKKLNDPLSDVFHDISKRYNDDPAFFTTKSGTIIKLPLTKNEFDAMTRTRKLSKKQITKALQSYYQHPTHTFYRYLSKPNPWMSPLAQHVHFNQKTNERWANISAHQELISILWVATNDPTTPATDGFTINTRVDEFIREIALMGRAHNWDKTREKKDSHDAPVLDTSGKVVREHYDDLEGDKPSCLRGIEQRIFQALKGHPLNVPDIHVILPHILQQHLRNHMRTKFSETSTHILETVLIDYAKLAQDVHISETLTQHTKAWNVVKADISQWHSELVQEFVPLFSEAEIMASFKANVIEFFKGDKSNSHFLVHVQRCQLEALCLSELNHRDDSLSNRIEKYSVDLLPSFLQKTNEINGEIELVKAIHLGLLGKIGRKLGKEAFAQLLCPDEYTQEAYASILVPYAQDERLVNWLSPLHETHKHAFLSKITEMATQETSFSPVEHFIFFLHGLDQSQPGVRQLHIAISHSAHKPLTTSSLVTILNQWLTQFPSEEITATIREKVDSLERSNTDTPAFPAGSPDASSASVSVAGTSTNHALTFFSGSMAATTPGLNSPISIQR